jgi:hypothetical protein
MTISDEHLKALGTIAAAYGALESSVDGLIRLLIKDIDVGRIICEQIDSFEKRLDLMEALFEYRQPNIEWHQKLKELRKGIRKTQNKRNGLLHSVWLRQKINPDLAVRVARKRSHEQVRAYSVAELNQIADEIRLVTVMLLKFGERTIEV